MNAATITREDAAAESTSVENIDELRRQLAALSQRVAQLEAAAGTARAHASEGAAGAPAAQVAVNEVSPEIAAIIAATIAAYLGVKPRIRQISLVGGASWAQQGRVTIQASHAFAIQRD